MKMLAQGYPLVFNERRGNPYTRGTGKELPLHTQVKKKKLKVKTKEDIQRPEILDLRQMQKMRG